MEDSQPSLVDGRRPRQADLCRLDPVAPRSAFALEWPALTWFNLVVSTILGFLYALYVMGPALHPRNISWLKGDASSYYVGWALFRQDPHFHWPLSFTTRVGYPIGESVALMDINPLLAILFKPFSAFLPHPFQYLGLEVILACVLQVFFALKLFRVVVGSNPLAVVLPSLFFLVSPIMALRMSSHYTLTNHWLLTAALYLFCFTHIKSPPVSNRRFIVFALVLTAISIAINPYLAFQVLVILTAAVIGLLCVKRMTIPAGAAVLMALAATFGGVAYIIGFITTGGVVYTAGGYRFYSMNLLSPFDPGAYRALFLPALPHFTDGQYEGYAYLGLGVMLLAIIGALAVLARRQKLLFPLKWGAGISLVLCCVFMTAMALSTQVSVGRAVLVDLDPSQKFTPYLATFRSSGRMFWTPYYVLLIVVPTIVYLSLRRRWANVLLALAFALQIADERPLHKWLHVGINQPSEQSLQSPVWSRLGSTYRNLAVMPPYQCSPATDHSPGGKEGWVTFGLLAAAQQMTVNSYNPGRMTHKSQEFHCVESVSQLAHGVLSADTAYVVMPDMAAMIVRSNSGKCHDLDGFILCSAKDDFGLGPSTWISGTERWIRSEYKTILLRDPSGTELTTWTEALNKGTQSSADFMQDLLTSAEFESKCLPRFRWYLDKEGRWPTLAEWLKYRPSDTRTGGGEIQNGHLSDDRDRAIVCLLYFALLQRDPAASELSGWQTVLARTSVKYLSLQFLNSAEYKSRGYVNNQ